MMNPVLYYVRRVLQYYLVSRMVTKNENNILIERLMAFQMIPKWQKSSVVRGKRHPIHSGSSRSVDSRFGVEHQ